MLHGIRIHVDKSWTGCRQPDEINNKFDPLSDDTQRKPRAAQEKLLQATEKNVN
jgi:hypothetical protein